MNEEVPKIIAWVKRARRRQQDARQYYEIDLHEFDYDEARQTLSELTSRLQEVHKSSPLVSKRAYKRAKKNIEKVSGQTYEVDVTNENRERRKRDIPS